jgi:alcohol dehydrogenase YqhD (iron-dependent ADH family)
MRNFTIYNPVKLHFGKNVCETLGEAAKAYGKNVLLLYGKGSAQRFGYYDIVKDQLEKAGMNITEFSGIKPNPINTFADEAAMLGRKAKVDLIVALGGGSVIDSAKYIAVSIKENTKVWDIAKNKTEPKDAVPLIAVLTIAATGTEMNQFAVIQNDETNEKIGYGCDNMYPKESFLDPQFTYSVPPVHTTYGVVDLIAHSLENFFGIGESPLADRVAASVIKEAMHYGPKVLEEPENYEYRANIMMMATMALNGTTAWGKNGGDWGVHSIGHNLSVMFDTSHGASLSVAYPAWFKHIKNTRPERLQRLSELVFDSSSVDDMIHKFEDFFESINAPLKLSEIGIGRSHKQEIIDLMKANKVSGSNYKLSDDDYESLTELMYGT